MDASAELGPAPAGPEAELMPTPVGDDEEDDVVCEERLLGAFRE